MNKWLLGARYTWIAALLCIVSFHASGNSAINSVAPCADLIIELPSSVFPNPVEKAPLANIRFAYTDKTGKLGAYYSLRSSFKGGTMLACLDALPVMGESSYGLLSIEIPWHLSQSTAIEILPQKDGGLAARPRLIVFDQIQLISSHTMIFFLPGIIGVLIAILQFQAFGLGSKKNSRRSRIFSSALTQFSALLWMIALVLLLNSYLTSGSHLIPLFWPDVYSSIGVVAFAFLGTLVYVAWRVYVRTDLNLEQDDYEANRLLQVRISGRLLVAPYVATVIVILFGSDRPDIATSGLDMALAFTAGLWIKPVLNLLNKFGLEVLEARIGQYKPGDKNRISSTRQQSGNISYSVNHLLKLKAQLKPIPGVIGMGLSKSGKENTLVAYVSGKPSDVTLPA
ncbi:MAG: hypothetical protein V3T17_14530 [Pseudomonadales bacterium]